MSELQYQLDLLKAMNHKLSQRESMYRSIIGRMDGAYLYYSFETKEFASLGKWVDYFRTEIKDYKDVANLYELFDASFEYDLREVFFPETAKKSNASLECMRHDHKRWFRINVDIAYDEQENAIEKIISIIDITKYKRQNEELTYFAYYDTLTGLYNRNYFIGLLKDFLQKAKTNNEIVSVMIIDINAFHKINDSLGLVVGDEVIQQFGSYLKGFTNNKVIACHLNSDVYCIAIYEPDSINNADALYKAIYKHNQKPYKLIQGQELRITVSIGVAEFPESTDDALELINCAEIALLKSKAQGTASICYFNSVLLNSFLGNVEIENKLKNVNMLNQLELYYQPQYFADSKKLRGVEALIRWKDAENHMISPSVFIPIAEKNGAIITIGNWVVEQSIKQFSVWKKESNEDFVLSVNISARQCTQNDFVDFMVDTIEKYDVDPTHIELEITESVLIEDFEMISDKLRTLKDKGIKISLDDFGTGFSSLSYLKRLPINTLKIDKSFIDTVLTDSATRIITESIIDMVKSLGFESVAEGVEEEQQLRYLHAVGCDIIQGFLLGKPLNVTEFNTLLKATS